MRYSLVCLAVTIFLFACSQPVTPMAAINKAEAAQNAKQMLIRYNDDMREHGLLAEFAYLDSSAEFFWVPPGYASALPFDAVAKAIRSNAAGIKKIDNNWDTLTVNLLSDSIAAYTGKMHSTVTDTLGRITTTALIETGTLVKRKDSWKLLCGQTAVLQ